MRRLQMGLNGDVRVEGCMANGSARFSGSQIMHSAIFKDLTTLRIFVRTVEIGSFSEVARRIDVTPAIVSKRIATLESEIGQRLLNRDTRRLVVTEAGERLYAHCIDRKSTRLNSSH